MGLGVPPAPPMTGYFIARGTILPPFQTTMM
jgi:hypothetical protein